MKTKKNTLHKTAEDKIITKELIKLLCEGNHEAYGTVYIHYRKPLELFLFSLLKSRHEAEEISQKVFVQIWEKRALINPDKKFGSFIYTMAKNLVMNKFNHQKVKDKYRKLSKFEDSDYITQEDILIAQETELIVKLAVSKMPRMRGLVYKFSYYHQLSNEDIAKKLGITKKNVANHLSQAKKEIKNMLILFFLFFIRS